MLLITGATGNVGSAVLSHLQKETRTLLRATVVSDEDAQRVPDGVETVLFDFANPATYPSALTGVKKVFLMRPPQVTDMTHTLIPFIDAAEQYAVEQILFLSLLGVENNPRAPHFSVEQRLKKGAIPYTFLRPSFYMQNLSTTHAADIRDQDRIYIPAGSARTGFVDARDVGAAAARILLEVEHHNQAYALTGGEALGYEAVAEIFSDVLGRKIIYASPSPVAFLWHSLRSGTSLQFALVMSMLYRETRRGMAEKITDDLARLLKRQPASLRQFIEDNRTAWE